MTIDEKVVGTFVFMKSEAKLWTVGFYDPKGTWFAESDHGSLEEAAKRVRYLNGGEQAGIVEKHIEALEWAIHEASGNKGGAMPFDFPWWDEKISKAHEALEQVKLLCGDPRKILGPGAAAGAAGSGDES